MTRLLRLVLLFGVMVGAATAASSAQAATWKHCGDVGITQDVRAKKLNCFTAKAVAERHAGMCDLARRTCQIDSFTCRRAFFGNSGTRVKCTYAGRGVKFFYGS